MTADAIDAARSQWAARFPDLDTTPLDVFGRIRRIAVLLQNESDRVLAVHDVSRADFDILSALARSDGPLTPTEIATTTLTSAPGTTKRLHRLAAIGMIVRAPNPQDGRGALIELTSKGQRVVLPVLHGLSELERNLIGAIASNDQHTLVDGLRMTLQSLETTGEEADEGPTA